MYIRIPKNSISLTIIKSICTNSIAISLVVIVPSRTIMKLQFHENITSYELITISLTSYTNSEINLAWLDYFIKYNDYSPNKLQRILLFDGALSYIDNDFAIRYKVNKI